MIIFLMNVYRGIVLFMYVSGIYGLFMYFLDKDIIFFYFIYYFLLLRLRIFFVFWI